MSAQQYLWPMEQPPVAPSSVLWLEGPDQDEGGLLVPASYQLSNPPGQSAPVVNFSAPVASQAQLNLSPKSIMPTQQQSTDTIIEPNCVVFIAPGVEVHLMMNENGDLYAKQIAGPNAGKSYNLTEGRWL